MTKKNKMNASLSLDLDNQWSYMKTHGDEGWEKYPSYLDLLIPRVLEALDKHNLKITFFIVGQDAVLDKNIDALNKITKAGHEVGNHSFHHEPWLHLYSRDQIEEELERAEVAIKAATGQRPEGFRGPGFSLSTSVLDTLTRRDYRYDASTFPTFIGPLARAYYFFKSDLPHEERQKRNQLFGTWSEGVRPIKPYYWDLSGNSLLEIPVTTMPFTRAPFHVSYILYLAGYSKSLAKFYFDTSLNLCRSAGVEPSLLLHPLDFLGKDDIKELGFFPGMNINAQEKLNIVDYLFEEFKKKYHVFTMSAHSQKILKAKNLSKHGPKFSHVEPSELSAVTLTNKNA